MTIALLLAARARPDARVDRSRVRPLALRAPVRDHLRGDRARRHRRSCPATRSCSSPAPSWPPRSLNVHVLVGAAHRRGDPRRLGQLRDRPLHRPARLRSTGLALVQAGAPAPHAGVLRQVRRRHDHHRPLRADHPHVRAVPRRRRRHELPPLPRRSTWSAASCGSRRSSTRATCSATSRGSRTT